MQMFLKESGATRSGDLMVFRVNEFDFDPLLLFEDLVAIPSVVINYKIFMAEAEKMKAYPNLVASKDSGPNSVRLTVQDSDVELPGVIAYISKKWSGGNEDDCPETLS